MSYRYIYRYTFPSRQYGQVVYVGQTNNPRRRDHQHKWEHWNNKNKLLRHAFAYFPKTKMEIVAKVSASNADTAEHYEIWQHPHVLNKVSPLTHKWLPHAIQKPDPHFRWRPPTPRPVYRRGYTPPVSNTPTPRPVYRRGYTPPVSNTPTPRPVSLWKVILVFVSAVFLGYLL